MLRPTLKQKIFLGFGIIVVLLFSNALSVYFGSKQINRETARMREIEAINVNVMGLDRDVQELRLRSDRYVRSGSESQAVAAKELIARLNERIWRLADRHSDPELAMLFEKIKSRIEQYAMNFDAIIVERKIRQDLVDEQLPKLNQQIIAQTSELADQMSDSRFSGESRLELIRAQSDFSQADNYFLRYFENPHGELAESAVDAIKRSLEHLNAINESGTDIDRIRRDIEEYEHVGLRAIQATRSYLFLRNVVIAGEESEVSYYSGKLRASANERLERIASELAAASERVRTVSWAIVVTACGLSLLIATRLAILIVTPISELTQTFEVLSSGNVLSKIPGTERRDEIGKMANAARIFSDQNSRTRELLKQSQELGQALTQKAAELQSINEELDSFAYVASHDLRSPLRGIKHLAEWIEEDVHDHLSTDGATYLENLIGRVTKLEVLLEDLLNFSRIGRLNPPSEDVSVDAVLENLTDMITTPDGVSVTWPKDLPTLLAVRAPLEQVFMNLIGNAIKHNDKGACGWVRVTWESCGEMFQFTIEDNGPGIDEANYDRIFKMYQRVGDPSIEGSGMGLAIVKKQIEYFGGQISVDSVLTEGTQFIFTWPALTASGKTDSHEVVCS